LQPVLARQYTEHLQRLENLQLHEHRLLHGLPQQLVQHGLFQNQCCSWR
jgi:hypothetical protein